MRNAVIAFMSVCFMFALTAQEKVDTNTPEYTLPENSFVGTDWVLDFSDEFEANEVDLSKWTINVSTKTRAARPQLGISDWWWKSENVSQEDGNLVLTVKKHDANTMHCGSIFSRDKYETNYGYFEARIKIADASKGTHTAFWLQGKGMSDVDGTANDGAEIDVFESAWLEDYTKSVVHIDGYGSNHQANTQKYTTPGIHVGYHTWGFYWTEDFMKIYYDGVLKVTYSDPKWVVQSPEYLWLSDGASFGYEGDHFTREAKGVLTSAYVDYIRVWKKKGDTEPEDPNLIMNGDFEDEINHYWTKNNSDIKLHENAYPVSDHDYYCRFPGVSNGRNISQTVKVEPGERYEFSVQGRIQNAHGAEANNDHSTNGPATLKVELFDGENLLLSLSTQSNLDTLLTGNFTVPEGIETITVKISKNWNVAYVDNVCLIKKKETTIRNVVNAQLSIFPNPCKDVILLQSDTELTKLDIVNYDGKIVHSALLNGNRGSVEVQSLPKGLYVLRIESKTAGIFVRKLVVD